MKKQKKEWTLYNYLKKIIVNLLIFIIKLPYYAIKKTSQTLQKIKIKKQQTELKIKREKIKPYYEDFKIIKNEKGNYRKWIKKIYSSDSTIGIILGARGSGKTAFGIKFLENIYAKQKNKCYAIGFDEKEMPLWVETISDINSIKNNSFILIDEGGILFSSRNSMSNANKLLSRLILIARHKNLSILFISQNSSNLEINILRQADFLVLKNSSLLQKDFERKIIQEIYKNTEKDFNNLKKIKGLTYIYSDNFKGFISNNLPSFWKTSISKSFQ